jgi:hypothetical protein
VGSVAAGGGAEAAAGADDAEAIAVVPDGADVPTGAAPGGVGGTGKAAVLAGPGCRRSALRQRIQRTQVDGDLAMRWRGQQQDAGQKPGQVEGMAHWRLQRSVPPPAAQ